MNNLFFDRIMTEYNKSTAAEHIFRLITYIHLIIDGRKGYNLHV